MNKRKLLIRTTLFTNKSDGRIAGTLTEVEDLSDGSIRRYTRINRKVAGENSFLLELIMENKTK